MTSCIPRVLLLVISVMLASDVTLSGFDFSELENAVTEHRLDNGLTMLILERHDAPVAAFMTMVKVGGANDPKGYTGLAHMFEHMAFKGTTTLGTKDIDRELELIAVEDSIFLELRAERARGRFADSAQLAQLQEAYDEAREASYQLVDPNAFPRTLDQEGGTGMNAGTSMDFTMYYVNLPSNRVELWMAMESERFFDPVLREMYKERDVIAEERRQRIEASPFGRMSDELKATAFKAHPYGVSIVGHMSDIQNFTREAAKKYFDTYYVPANMVITVVGDVKTKDVIKLAEKYWGRLPARPAPEPLATVEPPQASERRVVIEDPAQPMWAAAWHVPELTHPDFLAVSAMMDYLGQGRTSALYKNLVKEKKIASQVFAFAGYPAAMYPTLAVAFAVTAPEHTNAECEEQILAEIERIKQEPLPVEEVEKIKARAKSQTIFSLTDNDGLAEALTSYQTYFGDWREAFRELDRINALTPEDIQRVANEYFTSQNRTIATIETSGS